MVSRLLLVRQGAIKLELRETWIIEQQPMEITIKELQPVFIELVVIVALAIGQAQQLIIELQELRDVVALQVFVIIKLAKYFIEVGSTRA